MAWRRATMPRRWQPGGNRSPAGCRPVHINPLHTKTIESANDDPADRRLRRSALAAEIEALLFVSPDPLSVRKIEELLPGRTGVAEGLAALRDQLARDDSAFDLLEMAGGFRLLTRKGLAPWLAAQRPRAAAMDLTEPLRETLVVVAYRQPVTRATVETIRGVPSADHLKQLLDLGLIRIAGREATLGRPVIYRTSRAFLEWCGLASLAELPTLSLIHI